MKIKRYKKAERYMSLYKNNFGFREPYQVLLDGTFCQVALSHKVNIQEQLPRYLKGVCKLLTTACVVEETRKLGKPLHGAYIIVSQFPIHDCGHEEPISASKCLSRFIIDSKNKDHYLVATQDHQLRAKITKEVVCPLLKLANNTICMDKPAPRVESKVRRTHHYLANKLKDDERENLERLKHEENLSSEDMEALDGKRMKRKKKGPKGPNPLSCKKSKRGQINPQPDSNAAADATKRRKRRKKKNSDDNLVTS